MSSYEHTTDELVAVSYLAMGKYFKGYFLWKNADSSLKAEAETGTNDWMVI